MPLRLAAAIALACLIAGCHAAHADACRASWYGNEHHGRLTASGQRFDQHAMTAAHRTLAFGTKVRVALGARSVVVTITDRGPAQWTGRCIDLSRGAAERLGMIRAGVATVRIEVLR